MMKKLFLLACLMHIMPTFCMEVEKIKEWSTYFKGSNNETLQKSFIFATTDPNTKIILVQTNENIYFYMFKAQDYDLFPLVSAYSLKEKSFPNIQHYIPHIDIYDNQDVYIFYVVIKVPTIFFQEKYVVSKMLINETLNTIDFESLIEHDTPIMHLGMIEQDKKQYLVSGSIFPTIKICDVQSGERAKPLYNRFLLGCAGNKLLYMRKKNSERSNVITRWLYKDIDKTYDGTICTWTDPLKKKTEEIDKKLQMKISKDNYPLSFNDGSKIVLLDKKEDEIYIWSADDNSIDKRGAGLLKMSIKSDNIVRFEIWQELQKQLMFIKKPLFHLMKSAITRENYGKFLNSKVSSKTSESFFLWVFVNVFKKITNQADVMRVLSNDIMHEYGNILSRKKIAGIFLDDISLNEQKTYQMLQEYFTEDILEKVFQKYTAFRQITYPVELFDISFIGSNIKHMYAQTKEVFLQTDKDILKLNLASDQETFDVLYNQADNVKNIFIINNDLFMVTKDGLQKLRISF